MACKAYTYRCTYTAHLPFPRDVINMRFYLRFSDTAGKCEGELTISGHSQPLIIYKTRKRCSLSSVLPVSVLASWLYSSCRVSPVHIRQSFCSLRWLRHAMLMGYVKPLGLLSWRIRERNGEADGATAGPMERNFVVAKKMLVI